MKLSYEIIYVNDGSTDQSLDILLEQSKKNPNIQIIDLSRNFGKEIALTAGLDCASGDAIIPIDADLQHPPELFPELVRKWHEGYDVVYATRNLRQGEPLIKRAIVKLFYWIAGKITNIVIPRDTGDFRLISRPVANALRNLRERHRFMKGLFSWVGFKQTSVIFDQEPRQMGQTKWNYWKLWNFALEGITSFSHIPLQISSYLGLLISILSFSYGAYLVVLTLTQGTPVPGYPSLMVIILFFGGVQLVTLGIIGEYIGRIYDESKQRPLYIVKTRYGTDT